MRRDQLQPHFPADVTPEQLQKALENASCGGQIQNVGEDAQGSDERSDSKARGSLWQFIEQSTTTDSQPVPLVDAALNARSAIEVAWANFYSPRRGSYRSAAA
jgi:hypothetical protein